MHAKMIEDPKRLKFQVGLNNSGSTISVVQIIGTRFVLFLDGCRIVRQGSSSINKIWLPAGGGRKGIWHALAIGVQYGSLEFVREAQQGCDRKCLAGIAT